MKTKMKFLVTFLLVAGVLVTSQAQSKVYDVVSQMPEFPGGNSKMMEYIGQNLKYPKTAAVDVATVVLEFVVREDGSVTDVKSIKDCTKAFVEEGIRVVQNMPKWTPGKENGKPASVRMRLPIKFRAQ